MFPAPDEIAKTVCTVRILESIKKKDTQLQETYLESWWTPTDMFLFTLIPT